MKTSYQILFRSSDFGTERIVEVRDSFGEIIGSRDPFWPGGIPVSDMERRKRIKKVAREIIADAKGSE